ncbi:hypothetical protein ACHAQH_008275 [Verticillium albo-atrum]
MSLTCKQFLLIFGAIVSLWILWSAIFNTAMDTLELPFSIELGSASIAKVGGDQVQAQTGSEPATFTLKDGLLSSGDYILGRYTSEDRSFLPKPVFWVKKSDSEGPKVQRVTAKEHGAGLTVEDGKVFADLSGNDESKLVFKS